MDFFSVNTIAFSIWQYDMSYLELVGTVFNIASVYLVAKNKIATWPASIIGVILFGILFWQIQLYADLLEQVYYFITAIWGWYMWGRVDKARLATITRTPRTQLLLAGSAIAGLTAGLGWVVVNLDRWWPTIFPVAASYPYWDALTTSLSLVATVLMIQRRLECWYLWIAVDLIGIWLYAAKDVWLIAGLYLIFLVLATKGLLEWKKLSHSAPADLTPVVTKEALA